MTKLLLLCLCGYFAVNAFLLAVDGDRPKWAALIVALFALPIAIIQESHHVVLWLDKYSQYRTWWNYLFDRRALIWTTEELDRMNRITLKYRSGPGLQNWLWRRAAQLIHRVNGYTPASKSDTEPDQQ